MIIENKRKISLVKKKEEQEKLVNSIKKTKKVYLISGKKQRSQNY
jgi:preprotein translocase subunit YajC